MSSPNNLFATNYNKNNTKMSKIPLSSPINLFATNNKNNKMSKVPTLS